MKGKPSVLGICRARSPGGDHPGLGLVDPRGALTSVSPPAFCYWGTTAQHAFGYDDSLDAFGVHGVGGTVGALLTGVLAVSAVSGDAAGRADDAMPTSRHPALRIVVVAVMTRSSADP